MSKRKISVVIIVIVLSVVIGIIFIQNKGIGKGKEDSGKSFVYCFDENSKELYTEINNYCSDWRNMVFSLNGKKYTWPISYSQLVDHGYAIRKEDSLDYEYIEANRDTWGHSMYNEDKDVWLSVAFEGYVMPEYDSPNCYVYHLSVVKGFIKDYDDFVLCNGIRLDDSYDKVVAAMGEELEKEYYQGSGDDRFSVYYENDKNSRKIQFTFVDNRLESIDMYELK